MHLYLKSEGTLEATAKLIAAALPTHQFQLRDGLNLGGGEYFKFFDADSEILLVCNDEDHPEVLVEERISFPYYCYVHKGDIAILGTILASIQSVGFEGELGDAYA